MNIKAFLSRLRKTPRNWRVTPGGTIRLRVGEGPYSTNCCPITAVGPRPRGSMYYREHATDLGLSNADMLAIMHAADEPKTKNPRLRNRLLAACDLPVS